MIILKRKKQAEILAKLLVLRKSLQHSLDDDESRRLFIETFNAIADIADIVTGNDSEMFMKFAIEVFKIEREKGAKVEDESNRCN